MTTKEKLFCEACGEEEEFHKQWVEQVDFDVDCDCDGNAEQADLDECIDNSYRNSLDPDTEYTCEKCDSSVDFMSEEEILEEKMKHTDNEGNWHEECLAEDEWNTELKAELTAIRL